MKFKSYIALAACGLLFAACQTQPEAKTLSDFADSSKADSLVYYFAQMRGAEYSREAVRDTTLASDQAKKAYLMGVQAGLNAAKADNEAYNRGLFLGMQMAMNFNQFKKDYDVTLNKKVFVEGLAEALENDSAIDTQKMQGEFYRLMGEFNSQKEERDKAAASESLSKAASKLNMKKISDTLLGEVTEKTEGEQIKDGDTVDVKIELAKADGEVIPAPLPSQLKVGARNIPPELSDAIKYLKSGETGKFATSAQSLFGQRASQMGVEPADVVVMTIKATVAAPEAE